jgi:hypothetical protein
LPAGISSYIDNDQKKVVIKGTPTETGIFTYTITTIGGSTNVSVDGIFTVSIVETTVLTIEENEIGFCSCDGSIESVNTGFSGSGYINSIKQINASITWSILSEKSGNFNLRWRFANGSDSNLSTGIVIDGVTQKTIDFASTSSWNSWAESQSVQVELEAGQHEIQLEASTSSGLANIDYLSIEGTDFQSLKCFDDNHTNNLMSYNIRIFPNPVTNEDFTIELPDNVEQTTVVVFNVNGQKVFHQIVSMQKTIQVKNGFPKGLYAVVVQSANKTYTSKLIVN